MQASGPFVASLYSYERERENKIVLLERLKTPARPQSSIGHQSAAADEGDMAGWEDAIRSASGVCIVTLVLLAAMPAAEGIKESHTMKFNNLMGPSLRFLYW